MQGQHIRQCCAALPTGNRLRVNIQLFCSLLLGKSFCDTEILHIPCKCFMHLNHLHIIFSEASEKSISYVSVNDKVLFYDLTLTLCIVDNSYPKKHY